MIYAFDISLSLICISQFYSKDKVNSSAIKKIFLEYATLENAINAKSELSGRQFGNNVVHVTHLDESDYVRGNLK